MRLKLYRAADMAQAMRLVRAELGGDALILGSRRVAGGVEVTAGLDDADAPPAAPAIPRAQPLARPDPVLRAPPPGDSPRAPSPGDFPRAPSPADSPRTPSPGDSPRTPSPGDFSRTPSPGDPHREAALAYHGASPAMRRRLQAGPLPFALSAALRFTRLGLDAASPPLLLAGPPGAGKTLTTARLAARLVMAGTTPLVISADGQRAGATEQLAAFTGLLGITLLVASQPASLHRALARREAGAPVLIDAPGCDAFDPTQREGLAALAAVGNAAIALVLPCGMDPGEAAETAASLGEAGAATLVATRLDQARRLGSLLAAAEAGLALAEAGIGPGVADGLVPLTPDLLARRLMQLPAQTDPRA